MPPPGPGPARPRRAARARQRDGGAGRRRRPSGPAGGTATSGTPGATGASNGALVTWPTNTSTPSDAAADAQQTFIYPFSEDPSSFDFNKDLYAAGALYIWEPLLRYDPDFNLAPGSATGYEARDNGATYIYKINPKATWSNGDPLTAEDYIWSWTRQLDPKTGEMREFKLPAGTTPHSIINDRDGYIWFTGNGNGTVGRLDPRTSDIKVFGWDLTAQSVKGIDEGWVAAVVEQDPFTEGKVAVETIMKIKAGETVPAVINVPVTIVTKANVDKFRAMFK